MNWKSGGGIDFELRIETLILCNAERLRNPWRMAAWADWKWLENGFGYLQSFIGDCYGYPRLRSIPYPGIPYSLNCETGMKITDFYNEVARKADTSKTSISAAETKRVLSEAFVILAKMDAAELTDTLAKGLAVTKKTIPSSS